MLLKQSQWGNQIKTQEIEFDSDLKQIDQLMLSQGDQSIAYFLNAEDQLYKWDANQKNQISVIKKQLTDQAKLLSISYDSSQYAIYDIQSISVFSTESNSIQHLIPTQAKVEKLFFDESLNLLHFFDQSLTLRSYDLGTRQIANQKKLAQTDIISKMIHIQETSQIAYFNQSSSTINVIDLHNYSDVAQIDINECIERYTENNNQAGFILKSVHAMTYLNQENSLVIASQSQIIILNLYYQAIVKIQYLERVSNKSQFFRIKNSLYLASYASYSKEIGIYKILDIQETQPLQKDNEKSKNYKSKDIQQEESKSEDEEEQSVDLIQQFAQAYKDNPIPKFHEPKQNNGFDIIQENEGEDDEDLSQLMHQSFKDTSIYTEISKQIDISHRQGNNIDPNEVSCLKPFQPHAKGLFILMNQKIEQDSIYDHSDNYNKTRFSSNLPQKFSKTNMPVTFHKKIKSSGYSGVPNSLKFSKTQKQKQAQPQPLYAVTKNFYDKPLPITVPEELKILHEQPLHKNAITKLIYSPFGTKLACISQDTTISVLKTPMFSNKMELTSLGGHNGPVNSLHFSANDQYLISASSDKRCIIWNMKWSKKGEKLLILDRLKKNKTSNENPQNQALIQQQNPPLPDIVRGAQFYYDDKLLTVSCGNQLLFYQYELPDNPETSISKDDVKRLQQKGLYKLLQTFQHPTAQHIPSFHFHNHRLRTHIGLIGGSNKELIVYDANYNKAIATLNDGHQKHIHTVKFYEGSYGDSEAYNTFMTASSDNYIKLWDLRVGYPVREYGGYHQNRAIQIGFDISNCYRYLISGSEDRSVYVYDVGSGGLIDKTKNAQHGDSVTDIAINPVYYEWATSSIDGHVRMFRYPAYKIAAKPKPKNGGGGLQVKGRKVDLKQQQIQAEYYDQY